MVLLLRLSRTGAEGGYTLDGASHFGDVPKPHLRRPEKGAGFVVVGAAEAAGITYEQARDLFREHGQRDDHERPFFGSIRKAKEAVLAAELRASGEAAQVLVQSILDEFGTEGGVIAKADRPIRIRRTAERSNAPKELTWTHTL